MSVFIYCVFSRYGLPVNFQAMLLQPSKKTMKKLREVLNDLYKHLDSSAAAIIDVSTVIIYKVISSRITLHVLKQHTGKCLQL